MKASYESPKYVQWIHLTTLGYAPVGFCIKASNADTRRIVLRRLAGGEHDIKRDQGSAISTNFEKAGQNSYSQAMIG
jgi:hypothetical protein